MTERKKPDLSPVELRAAHALRRLRKDKDFTVRALSEAVADLNDGPSIGPNAISQIENEGRRMTISDAWALARALDVTPMEFFLPRDGDDGEEFAASNDRHGPNVLALRVIRQLYRLPDESVSARWRQIAKQSIQSTPAADADQDADRLDALEKSIELLRAELQELRNG